MASKSRLTIEKIHEFLQHVSEQIRQPTQLFLLGGSALLLLGNERSTIDIDYVGNDISDAIDPLQRLLKSVAEEMQIDVDAVPIEKFIPVPHNAEQRHRFFTQLNALTVYIFDPLSIALSKLDRGFESDLEDIVYLLRNHFIALDDLEQAAKEALPFAQTYDLSPKAMLEHLATVRILLLRTTSS